MLIEGGRQKIDEDKEATLNIPKSVYTGMVKWAGSILNSRRRRLAKDKELYNVYWRGDDKVQVLLGSTQAVGKAKACGNVHYRRTSGEYVMLRQNMFAVLDSEDTFKQEALKAKANKELTQVVEVPAEDIVGIQLDLFEKE